MRKTFNAICCLVAAMMVMTTSTAQADIIVDFTSTGSVGGVINGPFTFSSQDPNGTGVSFDITATAVIPTGGGANNGGVVARVNGGLGSTVENTGAFVNVIAPNGNTVTDANPGVSEVLEFTISNVSGLAPGESIVFANLLSQNTHSLNVTQTGGYGGTFGQVAADSVTLAFDSGTSQVINQSDAGNLGSILLNGDNGNNTNTGNTFAHGGLAEAFTTSFTVSLTDLTDNNAIVIQGFEFDIVSSVPEPSSTLLLGFGLATLVGRRRRRLG